jgi:hypothetical protein
MSTHDITEEQFSGVIAVNDIVSRTPLCQIIVWPSHDRSVVDSPSPADV